jgi:hypothetical protein
MNNDSFRLLAQQNGWSMARAQGFAAGETSRVRGTPPSRYAMIGIDDYSVGFRAGYFERQPARLAGRTETAVSHDSLRQSRTA